MSRRLQIGLILVAYVLVLGAPFLMRPPGENWEAVETLQIISPHWEGIKYEFRRGFRRWYFEQTEKKVDIEWLEIGGGSDIMRHLESEYTSNPDGGRIDIVFGGGPDFFRRLQKRNFLQTYRLPDDLLNAIPPTCAGVPMYDPEFHWYGAALSSFGLVYNKVILRDRGLSFPDSWEDLGNPELFTWIGAADPGKSSSVHMMFEIVLQAYGWEKGMDIISRMGANARYFSDSSSQIPQDVALGEVAIGMCIDFYAGAKIAEVGVDRVGFAMPEGMTVINPDPIGILKGAPQLESSRAFLRYVLSRPGQQRWMYKEGIPGGPTRFGLARLGVMTELYKDAPEKLLVESNPFLRKGGFEYNSPKGSSRWQLMNDFIRTAIIDTHEDAVKAWKALKKNGLPPEALRKFGEVPLSEDEFMALTKQWKNPEFREKTRSEWVRWFRNKYLGIAASL